jgi:hypothetical protein
MKLKFLTILFLFLPTVSFANCKDCHIVSVNINEEVITTAKKYLGVKELTNNNDSPEIDKWLKNCGLGKGFSYCAAYSVYMFKETFESYGLKSPLPNTAGVAKFAQYTIKHPFEFKVISTKKINWGIDAPEKGDVILWRHGSSINSGFDFLGHQGILISTNKDKTLNTIEGNTSSSDKGSQDGRELGNML